MHIVLAILFATVVALLTFAADNFWLTSAKGPAVDAEVSYVNASKISDGTGTKWAVLALNLVVDGKEENYRYADELIVVKGAMPSLEFKRKLKCFRFRTPIFKHQWTGACNLT